MPEDAGDPGDAEARGLARSLAGLLAWAHGLEQADAGNEVVQAVRGHLGEERARLSVVSTRLPVFEQVNVQVALDAWGAQDGRAVDVRGVGLPPNWGGVSLQQLLLGVGLPPVRLSAPELTDLPSGPDRTVACLVLAVLLVTDARGPFAVLVVGPVPHQEPVLLLEVAGLPTVEAQAVLRELADLRTALNVYRGQVLELRQGPMGQPTLEFPVLPRTDRDDVVLPERVLARVERHALGISRRRAELLAAGQHLKRGLLLYGPPGTGKTHTTRYLVQQLPGTTVLLLSGRSLHLVGQVAALARELQPAAVVLEDVDLVAEDRGYGPGPSPVLFELLDAMDGAAADADLLFLLTTNRADLLEPALAARPGRVDVAVEIALPDADARRRLLAVHARGLDLQLDDTEVAEVVERSAGVTASFLKELLRRALLAALESGGTTVRAEHVGAALDDLLDSTQAVTRALLGVGQPDGQRGHGGHGGVWAQGEPDDGGSHEIGYD